MPNAHIWIWGGAPPPCRGIVHLLAITQSFNPATASKKYLPAFSCHWHCRVMFALLAFRLIFSQPCFCERITGHTNHTNSFIKRVDFLTKNSTKSKMAVEYMKRKLQVNVVNELHAHNNIRC